MKLLNSDSEVDDFMDDVTEDLMAISSCRYIHIDRKFRNLSRGLMKHCFN